jgi:hypothetical protein
MTRKLRASRSVAGVHQCIEAANPCSRTIAGRSRGPSSRTWTSPAWSLRMRPMSAFAGFVSPSVTIVLTASRTTRTATARSKSRRMSGTP